MTKFWIAGVVGLFAMSSSARAADNYQGHGLESVSPEMIKKYLPPPVDPIISRVLQSALDVRAPGSGKLTLDGKHLFFNWSVTGVSQVWRLDQPKGFPVQVTGGEDPTQFLESTPDQKWVIVSRDRKGEENPGLYLQRLMGGALEVIQHKPKVQTVYQGVSADSKWVYYRANDVQPDSYALYRFNIESRASERIFDQAGIWSIADHRDDRTFLLEKATGSLSSEFFEFDLASKTLTPLLGQNEKEEYQVQFSSQKGELLVLSNKMGDFKRLYRWKAGTFTPVTPDVKMDVSGFTIDHAHRRIYTMTNDQGYSRTQVFDAHTYRTVPLPSLPKDVYHITVASLTRNGRFAVFGVETVKAPKTSYVWDWNSKKLTQWVVPGAPEIDTSKFVQSVLESYPARDGTPIPMFVRRSEKCKAAATPCPVLVHFHGGPEGQSVPYFSAVMQAVVDQGYILVEPNVRGSDGYGRKYIESDNGPKRLDVISDIEDCSKFIRSSWAKGGKTPKIGIFGWSYGGYSTFFAMTRFAGAYDAGVAMVGMSNLYTFLMNTAPYRRILRISEYGDPEKDKEALKKLSPITYLDQVRSPLLITQGVNDPRVPAGEAIQIQEALTRKKIPSQLILFGDEGHGATKRENRVLELGNLIQFFNKHLQ